MVYSPRRVPVIIRQEQAFLKAHEQFQTLIEFVGRASVEQECLDQVERGLLSRLLELGRSLLTAFVAAAGDGDAGEITTAPDGSVQRRLPEQHSRIYRSIFGTLSIRRYVYGTREGQRIACVPLDARLGLPEGEFSYVLQDWLQRFAVKGSFAEAAQSLQQLLGLKPSVRSIEDMNRTMADVAATFTDQRPIPPAAEEGELVVLTGDGKGVVMRRPAVAGPRQSPQPNAKGKTGKKANGLRRRLLHDQPLCPHSGPSDRRVATQRAGQGPAASLSQTRLGRDDVCGRRGDLQRTDHVV
jgi:hypothetical protein